MNTLRSIYGAFCSLLFPPTDTARLVAEVSPEVLGRLLSPTTLAEHTIGLLPYRHPLVRALIIEAKFHRNVTAYERLGLVLGDFLTTFEEDRLALSDKRMVLIPVPLGANRRKERGYNQIEEVLQKNKRPYDTTLVLRTEETRPQTTLTRNQRLENVVNAFKVVAHIDPDTLYIVVDDVTTTGATLNEVCETLRRAGATEVVGVALAH